MSKKVQKVQIPVVDEINGYVTPVKAAEMLGLAPASMSAKIKDQKVDAIKIGGIILLSKESVERFAQERKSQGLDVEHRANLAKLQSLFTPEEIAELIASKQK